MFYRIINPFQSSAFSFHNVLLHLRFIIENQLLDEESFLKALKDDQGRITNVSLFDELRLSISRHNIELNNDIDRSLNNSDNSMITIGTQTDEGFNDSGPFNNNDAQNCSECKKDVDILNENCDKSYLSISTQTDVNLTNIPLNKDVSFSTIESQTNTIENTLKIASNITEKCLECDNLNKYTTKLESDLKYCHSTITDMQLELDKYEANLNLLQKFMEEGNERNNLLQTIVQELRSKIGILEAACSKQNDRINELICDVSCAECQTDCGNFVLLCRFQVCVLSCKSSF